MSVMPHMNERERWKVKDIDYNISDAVGKPDNADTSGLTPIRTRRLKAEDTNTTQVHSLPHNFSFLVSGSSHPMHDDVPCQFYL